MFFTKITNKEDTMKNEKEKPASWTKAELSAASASSVVFNETTKSLTLEVNGEVYRQMECKDILSGKIKFHQGIQEINSKFNLWKYDDKRN